MTQTHAVASTTTDVVNEFFAAFGRGDMTTLLSLIADDAEWIVPGDPEIPYVGTRQGKRAITDFFSTLSGELDAKAFDVTQVVVSGADAVATGHFAFTVQRTGRDFSSDFAIHFRVQDGQVVRYQIFEDSYAVSRAFTR